MVSEERFHICVQQAFSFLMLLNTVMMEKNMQIIYLRYPTRVWKQHVCLFSKQQWHLPLVGGVIDTTAQNIH